LILHEENKPVKVQLKHINMEEKKKMKKIWMRFGFNEEILLPLLMRMRYLTSDIMNRVNKSVHTKKMVALACEFFIGAEDNVVYFSSFVGLQWENQKSTWEKLRDLDSISRAIYEYYSFFSIPSTHDDHEKKTSQQLVRNIDLLAFYDQMNPRFPSIQSSRIVETQWKCRSPLLAPDVSPRYFGAEMPKSYRKGHFYPLLTEKQSYTVNRLYLSPRGTYHSFECKQSSQPPLSPSRPDASGRGKILSSKIRADPQRSLKK
jgi:hypothetical protein